MFFAVRAGACFIFCCLGGGTGPAQTAKKKHVPAQTAKKNLNMHPPLPSVFFFLLSGRFFFFLSGRVHVIFCCLGGASGDGVLLFFLFFLFGRVRVFVFLFGRLACFFCWLLGGGNVCVCVCFFVFLCLLFGRVMALFKRPNKKDQTAKKNTRSIQMTHGWY